MAKLKTVGEKIGDYRRIGETFDEARFRRVTNAKADAAGIKGMVGVHPLPTGAKITLGSHLSNLAGMSAAIKAHPIVIKGGGGFNEDQPRDEQGRWV